MKKLSYHLILVNSSLRVLTDQIDQLNKIIEEDQTKPLLLPVQNKEVSGKQHSADNTLVDKHPSFTKTSEDKPQPEKKSIQKSVYDKIKRTRKGIAFKQIQKKTGFNSKQIANAIYKLKERNLIIAKSRGVYVSYGGSAKS